jgi:hypothetical protein
MLKNESGIKHVLGIFDLSLSDRRQHEFDALFVCAGNFFPGARVSILFR